MAEKILPGHYIYVDVHNQFYRIVNVEPFEYRTGEESTAHFSAVEVDGESGHTNITTLEPDDVPRRLFQVRMGVMYGFKYYIKIPTGTARFGIDEDKNIGFLDNFMSPFDAPNEDFEFFLVNSFYPSINAKNKTSISMTPRIHFVGFKYDIEEVKDGAVLSKLENGQMTFKKINIGGVKG